MRERPMCHKCGRAMTPENARIHPEYFLHDACLPDELRPAPAAPTATGGAGPAAGGRQAGEPVGRCEGCHFAGVVRIQVPNGVLTLCRQCLDTVNRKNPELVALRPRLAALEAAAGEALIPLAALVLDERSNGPIREICPELREAIRKALDACRAALAGGGG